MDIKQQRALITRMVRTGVITPGEATVMLSSLMAEDRVSGRAEVMLIAAAA